MARDTTFYLYENANVSLGDTHYFATRAAQTSYFTSKLYRTVTACSYQREGRNYFTVNLPISNCYRIDYCAYVNPSYENKVFYCFVTGCEYVSDNCTIIYYDVDQLQTWLLDCTLNPCFIERCHSATDNIGDNILAENLETGDYIIRSQIDSIDTMPMVVIQATFDLLGWATSGFTAKPITTTYVKNGIVSALSETGFYLSYGGSTAGSLSALGVILENIYIGSGGVTMDDIVNMYIYPKIGLELHDDTNIPGVDQTLPLALQQGYTISNYQTVNHFGYNYNLPTIPTNGNNQKVIGNYIPKNNKLFTFPYCLMHITNNNGSAVDLHYERFALPNTPDCYIFGTSTAEGKIRLAPNNYYGSTAGSPCLEYSIDSAPFPTVAQIGDSYNIWLAQNRNTIQNDYNSMGAKRIQQVGNMVMNSLKSMDPMQMIQGGYNLLSDYDREVSYYNGQLLEREIAPNTATGVQSFGLSYQNGYKNFSIFVKTVDEQHARIIDDYWTMFGYPSHIISIPPMHNRSGFTYVKTVGCIIRGDVPENAKMKIEQLFNNGLRFWADHAHIGDFTISNNIIT